MKTQSETAISQRKIQVKGDFLRPLVTYKVTELGMDGKNGMTGSRVEEAELQMGEIPDAAAGRSSQEEGRKAERSRTRMGKWRKRRNLEAKVWPSPSLPKTRI